MKMSPDELQRVRSVPLFAGLTEDQLGCLEAGEVIEVPAGTVLATEGQTVSLFLLVLEGEIRLTRNFDRQTVLMGSIKPGSYTGETTLLLDVPWLATARVSKPARFFRLSQDDFWHMLSTCRTVARQIFRTAASKVRNMENYTQQREKLISLGTMAAGLAHELNNPAAAAHRAAAHLRETSENAQCLLCNLSRTLEPAQLQLVVDALQTASERLAAGAPLDNLERSDRADKVAAWLDARDFPKAWELAPTFVSAGVDAAWLQELANKLPPAYQVEAISWVEACLGLELQLTQVEQSTRRIAELVKAVKSYSYMDQSPMQEVDIHEGIESTLTMLGHKLKNVTLVRAFDRTVPRIMAYGSELNQVWTNLIDNAIHAVNGAGKICVGTSLEDDSLLVEIVDNGSGIPLDVQAHMFEPFFTTKPVGTGTGLGLVISNRIVADRHGGEIEFESRPGETRFKVRLPIHREQPTAP
jgi:signal transduction histidine kinase